MATSGRSSTTQTWPGESTQPPVHAGEACARAGDVELASGLAAGERRTHRSRDGRSGVDAFVRVFHGCHPKRRDGKPGGEPHRGDIRPTLPR